MVQGQRRFPGRIHESRAYGSLTHENRAHENRAGDQTSPNAASPPDVHNNICVGPAQIAVEYIVDMAEQLSLMARGQRLEMLAYLLDMARLEAESVLARQAPALSSAPARGDVQGRFEI